MNGTPKDIDPASELREEDEEPTLPELETAEAPPGTLAAGRAAILRAVKHAPSRPGVYRMIDAQGEVLYVGKAKNIKKRVTAYTRPTGHDTRIVRMISGTVTMEFVTTKTETEALLLEANLIKRLRPRFNVLLRDDKSFPFILITSDHWAPQILKHRGARTRAGHYYGPFANAGAVNRTINALQRAFLLRSCSDSFFEARTRPCLLYQIKRCSAPCTQEIDFAGYAELVREANEFLSGRSRLVQKEMAAEMDTASDSARFRARRDLSRPAGGAVGDHVASGHQSAHARRGRRVRRASGRRLHLRRGVLLPHRAELGQPRLFPEGRSNARASAKCLSAFLAQFYDDKPPPRLVLVSHEFEERALLAAALTHQERPQGRGRRAATRRAQGTGAARARQCARGAGAQARRHVVAAEAAEGADRDALRCRAARAASRSTTTATSPAPMRSAPWWWRGRKASARTSTASSTSARRTLRPATTTACCARCCSGGSSDCWRRARG